MPCASRALDARPGVAAEAFAANKAPWPFDAPTEGKEVIEFARDALKVDDSKKCRLSAEELADYKAALQEAQDTGSWGPFGLIVYELADRHPYLPEPAESKLMYTDVGELPNEATKFLIRKGGPMMPAGPSPALRAEVGRLAGVPARSRTAS